ncbi:N-acetylmuramoyl-L-alanine amidase [Promicromonospora sp. NPDC050249]|uniref:peptidoglycan recognition protein family protein n=1 Tax=Promicromonospora sp. NPDC050249 TaxID=3154743 RepID=UPI0033D513A0
MAPTIVLGGALAPAATALSQEPSFEPEGTSAPLTPQESVLPDAGPAAATVENIAIAAAPAASERVSDVTTASPEVGTAADTVADGEVVLDTTDSAGRIAGEVAAPGGFQTVGLRWPAAIDAAMPELQVRALAADGAWGEWAHLEKSSDVPDGEQTEFMSAPVHVGDSVAVQVATVNPTATLPEGAELTLVASDQVSTAAAKTSGTVAATSDTPGPTIITRAEWGAAPPRAIPECPPDGAISTPGTSWGAGDRLEGAVVHHTVNPNDYATVAEAMQLIRNDQAYHQESNGWCDIGYNFLVDKWGNIYEGAQGSIDAPIIGAHAGGFNNRTVGVSMLGTFMSEAPSAEQMDGVAQIAGFRLAEYGVDPAQSATFTSAGLTDTGRYDAGEQVVLPRVFGHRDTHYTACPGDLGYPQLASIQAATADYAEQYAEYPEQTFNLVQAIYRDSFGREATPAEVDGWVPRVAESGPGVLADGMEQSSTYRRVRINEAFQTTLGFKPTNAQIAAHLELIKGGRNIDEHEALLMATNSYYYRVGGTERAYMTALFRHILGRTPTANSLTSWVNALRGSSRTAIIKQLWDHPDAVRNRVVDTYGRYGVTPTASGTAAWVEALRTDSVRGEAPMRRGIIVSSGYAARADARY